MILRNEIIEPNQIVLLRVPHTTTSYKYDGEWVILIDQNGYTNTDVFFDNDVAIQSWEVKLVSGKKVTARMIIWLGEHNYAK